MPLERSSRSHGEFIDEYTDGAGRVFKVGDSIITVQQNDSMPPGVTVVISGMKYHQLYGVLFLCVIPENLRRGVEHDCDGFFRGRVGYKFYPDCVDIVGAVPRSKVRYRNFKMEII